MTRPADFPPPFAAGEFVAEPTDPVDERIEVGVLVVGAGPAGLACAIRFGQLLEENPDVAERLGDVPLAVLEKGKQPGSHLLSGAIVNPRSLRTLLGDDALADMPSYGPVPKESVYLLTGTRAVPIPPPPTMRNHGNVIVSLSELGRWLAERAEDGGAMILPETAAQALLVDDGRVVGVRTGDKGRGSDGEELGNFEPGSDIVAQVTVLAEGTQGHLTGVALDHFDLRGDDPQVWELGVKEVWKVPQPLDRIIHTMGWPLRPQAKYREFGGSFIYPMGDDMLSIGMVVGLDYRDPTLSPHDLLQELKTHPKIRPLLDGGERLEWGAKTIPGGGFHALPKRLYAPGLLLCGDGPGMVNIPTLKGVHYAIEAGRLAAETAFAALARGDDVADRARAVRRRGAVRLHRARISTRCATCAPRSGAASWSVRRARARCRSRRVASTSAACATSPTTRTSCCRSIPPRSIPRTTARSPSTGSRRCSRRGTRRATTNRITSGSSSASPPTSRSCGRTCARRRSTPSAPRATTVS